MPLTAGAHLGAYEILAAIGAGGMGEVYRARDHKLDRDVAIKILPEAFVHDADRLARFQREAKTLASLNHPGIAGIYGLEENGGVAAIVMELVEGEDLSQRIARGAIPIDDALPIAKQIADALEAAHEQEIIHRDLKPANIKVRPDGTVKVLDFGLAKALDPAAVVISPSASMSPTITTPAMTMAGMILGTAAYMSPEQARGRTADKRSDIWAFGCVFYEMLTGERAFRGEDVTETLASIVKDHPTWERVSPRVRRALQACLEKDPKKRLRDIGDVWRLIEQDDGNSPPVHQRRARAWFGWSLSAIAGGLLAASLTLSLTRQPPPAVAQPLRFHVAFPPDSTPARATPTLSPDGQRLAFLATDNRTNQTRVWIHELNALESHPLTGTEGAIGTPFWLADNHTLVFGAGAFNHTTILKKIAITGGPPLALTELPATLSGGFSTVDGPLVISARTQPLLRLAGGTLTRLTTLDEGEGGHRYPALLPDGIHFMYVRSRGANEAAIYLGGLHDAPNAPPTLLLKDATTFSYVSEGRGRGYIVFSRGGVLLTLSFDERALKTVGEPIPISQGVGAGLNDPQIPLLTASIAGPVVYEEAGDLNYRQLKWFDRSGAVVATVGDPTNYTTSSLRLSPTGTRAIVGVRAGSAAELWLFDLERGGRIKVVSNTATNFSPVWSPDSSSIIFSSTVKAPTGLYRKSVTGVGGEERLTDGALATDWSHDGRFVLFQLGQDLGLLRNPNDHSRTTAPLPHSSGTSAAGGAFSPDGRWIAYSSVDANGEVYLRRFDPDAATRAEAEIPVSTSGGSFPHWRGDGKALFYQAGRQIMAVAVETQPALKLGKPQALFTLPAGSFTWDVTPNGERFLVIAPVGEYASPPFTVLLNWQTGLKN